MAPLLDKPLLYSMTQLVYTMESNLYKWPPCLGKPLLYSMTNFLPFTRMLIIEYKNKNKSMQFNETNLHKWHLFLTNHFYILWHKYIYTFLYCSHAHMCHRNKDGQTGCHCLLFFIFLLWTCPKYYGYGYIVQEQLFWQGSIRHMSVHPSVHL